MTKTEINHKLKINRNEKTDKKMTNAHKKITKTKIKTETENI